MSLNLTFDIKFTDTNVKLCLILYGTRSNDSDRVTLFTCGYAMQPLTCTNTKVTQKKGNVNLMHV